MVPCNGTTLIWLTRRGAGVSEKFSNFFVFRNSLVNFERKTSNVRNFLAASRYFQELLFLLCTSLPLKLRPSSERKPTQVFFLPSFVKQEKSHRNKKTCNFAIMYRAGSLSEKFQGTFEKVIVRTCGHCLSVTAELFPSTRVKRRKKFQQNWSYDAFSRPEKP